MLLRGIEPRTTAREAINEPFVFKSVNAASQSLRRVIRIDAKLSKVLAATKG